MTLTLPENFWISWIFWTSSDWVTRPEHPKVEVGARRTPRLLIAIYCLECQRLSHLLRYRPIWLVNVGQCVKFDNYATYSKPSRLSAGLFGHRIFAKSRDQAFGVPTIIVAWSTQQHISEAGLASAWKKRHRCSYPKLARRIFFQEGVPILPPTNSKELPFYINQYNNQYDNQYDNHTIGMKWWLKK